MVGCRGTDALAGGVKKASASHGTPPLRDILKNTCMGPASAHAEVQHAPATTTRLERARLGHLRRRHDIRCIDCDVDERSRRYRPTMLVMVATSLIEYALDSRWTRGSQTDVLWTSSAPSNHASPSIPHLLRRVYPSLCGIAAQTATRTMRPSPA